MKAFLKKLLRIAVLGFVLLGCHSNGEHRIAKITVRSASQRNAIVRISLERYLDQVTLVESKTDSSGYCSFDITLEKPMFALIQIGKKYGEVHLVPNDDLMISENGQDYKIPLTFSGKGAELNNYISWVNSNVEKIKWANGRGLNQLGTKEFLARFDSLKAIINDFHERYIDSVELLADEISVLELKNRIKFLEVGQEYKFYQLNNFTNEKWEAQKNGQNYMEGKLSGELETIDSEIPFDKVLLKEGSGDYQMLLNYYWHNQVHLPTVELIGPNGSVNLAPLVADSLIRKADYPEEIREFLMAFDLRYWLTSFGITPETDSVFTGFRKTYPKSNYLPALNRSYNEWLAIGHGKPAPEFEGYTAEGKRVSIKDLRGKIVYIDVWATWCSPCIAEIPASKRLQKELLNDDRVQFLNVSVDSRRSDWEKFLQKNKSWRGLHIIIDPELIQSFYTTYKISGIPDYMLIDQAGNIINRKASRPSVVETKAEIQQLLASRQAKE